MKAVLSSALLLILLCSTGLAQGICYVCHSTHGDIWQGSRDFHSGGSAHCNICHTMHNSQDNDPVNPDSPTGMEWLINRGAVSDVCLTCHAGAYGSVFGNDVLNPPNEVGGGNFVFLLEDNINDGYGGNNQPILGQAAGHNIESHAMGSAADEVLVTTPGGSFRSADLTCTSCHDPHGNQNFRMLYGAGTIQDGLYEFVFEAPDAEGLSIYHGNERTTRHTAYRSGMSQWCGNCHLTVHESGDMFAHPTDAPLGTVVAGQYNAYAGSADQDGGSISNAYIPQVPFEDPASDIHSQAGPNPSSVVMCLTCHRAHASSAPDAGRWDFAVTQLASDGMESGSYPIPSPYPDAVQRSLCNKCHGKDAFDDLTMR